jgi:hypothetical protein
VTDGAVLQTLRSHDQYNTTIYGLDDRYRGVKGGRRVVFVNWADLSRFGLNAGDRVDLVSEFTNGDGHLQERRAADFMVVPYPTPMGNASAYYPETNPLVPLDHTAAKSNTPTHARPVSACGGADPLASYNYVDGISRWGVSASGTRRARARMPPHFRHRTRQRKRQRVRTNEASRARLDGDLATLCRRRRDAEPRGRCPKPAVRPNRTVARTVTRTALLAA